MTPDEKQSIEKLYIEMYRRLYAYAVSALRDGYLAEEAVQDTFRIACAKRTELLSSASPQGWLMLTVKNTVRTMIRTRNRLTNLVTSLSDSDLSDEAVSDNMGFEPEYSELLGKDYDLIVKVAVQKFTIAEAAKELGISVEACKKRVQRAKKKLKDKLERMGGDGSGRQIR